MKARIFKSHTRLIIILLITGLFSCQKGSKKILYNTPTKYQSYKDNSKKLIDSLPKERLKLRDEAISKLIQTETYKSIIDSSIVEPENLILLTAINNGVRSSFITVRGENRFTIDEKLVKRVSGLDNGNDKMNFVINSILLSFEDKGGFPTEVIEMFDRYRSKYNLYGMPSTFYDLDGNVKWKIEYAYNMSSIFGLIQPKSKNVLNAIYEANKIGAGRWLESSDQQKYIYEHFATKQGYMNYIKKINPDSPYILKVDYEVTANQLYREYAANEVAADNKYKNKKLAVYGEITSIGNDILDDSYITLKTENFIKSIQCYLDKKVAANLQKGQEVIVIGKCKGLFGNIGLKDCEIWEN